MYRGYVHNEKRAIIVSWRSSGLLKHDDYSPVT